MGFAGYIAYPMCMRQYKLGALSIISSSEFFSRWFQIFVRCDAAWWRAFNTDSATELWTTLSRM